MAPGSTAVHRRRLLAPLSLAAGLVLLVLAAFAVAVVSGTAGDRRDAERALEERAKLTADVTASVFASLGGQGTADRAARFGGDLPSRAELDAHAKGGLMPWVALIGAEGEVLRASSGTPPEVLRGARELEAVKAVLGDAPYAMSDIVGGTTSWALPVPGAPGPRVLLQAIDPKNLATFLQDYLSGLPGVRDVDAVVVDRAGLVLGRAADARDIGRPTRLPGLDQALRDGRAGAFDSEGTPHRFATGTVPGSRWRVVLALPSSALYAGTHNVVAWIILVVLAAAGVVVLGLLRRTQRASDALAVAVEQLQGANAELERTNLELRRSNGELEQFASVASHDLQEPLRKIQAFGDQLERKYADAGDEAVDYVRRMRSAASRMSVLIEDLLQFSRVTTRARPSEPVDLARVARAVVADLDAAIEASGGTVHIGALPVVQADPTQARQLLQNLVSNAVKFRRPGEPPTVVLEPAEPRRPGFAAFRVTDDGIGIEPEYAERVFGLFERLHPRERYAGTGIGLALCRKIAERHGGSIAAEPAPGGGTSFLVELPAAGVAPAGEDRPLAGVAHG
jgi:signal transduction histidine kinase